jgi:hypothetical protein
MRTTSYFAIACILLFACASTPQLNGVKKVEVSGEVLQAGAHCGGARLPDDMLAEVMKPKPMPGQKMYVKKGKTNNFSESPVLEFVTDSSGRFNIQLEPGDYCIVNEFKKDKKNYEEILAKYATETEHYGAVDKECLAGWFGMPDFEVTVTSSAVKNISIVYVGKCPWNKIPCVPYHGPLPP